MNSVKLLCKIFGHKKGECLGSLGGLFSGGLLYYCQRCNNYLYDYVAGYENIATEVLNDQQTKNALDWLEAQKKPVQTQEPKIVKPKIVKPKEAPIKSAIWINVFHELNIDPQDWVWGPADDPKNPLYKDYYRVLKYTKSLPEKICPRHNKPYHVSIGFYGAKWECYDCLDEESNQPKKASIDKF